VESDDSDNENDNNEEGEGTNETDALGEDIEGQKEDDIDVTDE